MTGCVAHANSLGGIYRAESMRYNFGYLAVVTAVIVTATARPLFAARYTATQLTTNAYFDGEP